MSWDTEDEENEVVYKYKIVIFYDDNEIFAIRFVLEDKSLDEVQEISNQRFKKWFNSVRQLSLLVYNKPAQFPKIPGKDNVVMTVVCEGDWMERGLFATFSDDSIKIEDKELVNKYEFVKKIPVPLLMMLNYVCDPDCDITYRWLSAYRFFEFHYKISKSKKLINEAEWKLRLRKYDDLIGKIKPRNGQSNHGFMEEMRNLIAHGAEIDYSADEYNGMLAESLNILAKCIGDLINDHYVNHKSKFIGDSDQKET